MIRLTVKQVISLHSSLIEATGSTSAAKTQGFTAARYDISEQKMSGIAPYPML